MQGRTSVVIGGMMIRASGIALATVLALVQMALAQPRPWPFASPPVILRLDGTFHATAEAARKEGFAVLSVGFEGQDGAQRWFAVDDARTVGPDMALDGKDVLAELAPLWPNLLIAGPPAMVEGVRRLPEAGRVRMEGLVRRGARLYSLRSVEPAP
jgi:hypothetical protein